MPSIANIETVRDALAYEAGFEAQCRSCGYCATVPAEVRAEALDLAALIRGG